MNAMCCSCSPGPISPMRRSRLCSACPLEPSALVCIVRVRNFVQRWKGRRLSMDELALLKDFRLEDASPDGARDYARAALRTATPRERRPSRRTLVGLAFLAAAVLAGAAYGIVHQLIVGSPAPPEVREQPARF